MKLSRLFLLALRESRFARRRLLLFLSAISLGVASLVAVKGFAGSLSRGVREEARALHGADLEIDSRQPFGPNTSAFLDSLEAAGSPVAMQTSFASMAVHPGTGATRLVQVRAPEPRFPFYGTIETAPAALWSRLHEGRNALVDPALLTALRARVGDSISLGEARFRILGALIRVPGDTEIASAFAPRVYIPATYLRETRLLDFGSRVQYEAFIRLPSPELAEELGEAHRPMLRAERAGYETALERQEELEETFGQLSDYLGLVGVFALLLGGIGVASAMGAYMAQKADTVAVLRCLGATARQVLAIYLTQAGVMGIAGALLGVALGLGVQWILPRMAEGMLPVAVRMGIDGAAIATGATVGVWTAMIFALLPLLQIRRISPLGALRRKVEVATSLTDRDPARWAAWAALAGSVLLLLVVQVGDLRTGAAMLGGITAALTLLWSAAWATMWGTRRVRRAPLPYVARQGLANLYRPGNQTRTVVLALGFGVFLLATLVLTQHNLLLPLRTEGVATRANLLFFDVQDDQEPGLRAILAEEGLPLLQRAPIVPMRIASIDGEEVRPWTPEEMEQAELAAEAGEQQPRGWAVRREYRSTYRDSIVGSERLLDGEFWGAAPADPGQVSLERDIAEELAVGIGDSIVWDVQGVRIPTRVTSIREVDWARFEPNFFAVFPTATLAEAPKSWVALTRAPTEEARGEVQSRAVSRFPNVSAIDLTQVQAALDDVIGRISAIIRFLAAFSVATGFIVLLGAVSTSRLQRIREAVLLKTLGATRAQIGWILLTEYLLLGLLAVVVGTVLAVGAGWSLARWTFDTPFHVAAQPLIVLGALVALLSVAIGVWASREVFQRTPLESIREE